ncbi:hypothetical protein HYE67_001749 [Fusarium culmorum]|uniref:G domain-containing protein n=1 Tax=Fusarium culmorum TaxID=5516 RepID=A0A7S8D036_FUSCU|nr:hypothetical protein HYE67_001749 [Fusarium culmorum]
MTGTDNKLVSVAAGPVNSVPKSFRSGHAPRPNDAFIALMGITGSGKSSFISKCTDKSATIGHDMISCTSIVDVYPYEVTSDFTVYLIDTPGFDDTGRSDTEVLSEIAAWLTDSYKHEIRLHGIIYLHRISDVRMQGSAKKNLVTFKELCGEDALKKVVLASTMWDIIPAEKATKREQELKDTPEFWGWMLSKGSSVHRYNNTAESARGIILSLTGHNAPIATDLQKQMVDEGKSLDETSAGQGLRSELLKERRKLTQERQELLTLIEAAKEKHDVDTEEALQEESDRYTVLIKRAEDSAKALSISMTNLILKRDLRIAEMTKEMREVQNEYEMNFRLMRLDQIKVENGRIELENQRKLRRQGKLKSKASTSTTDTNSQLPGQRPEKGKGNMPATKIGISVSISKSFYILQSPMCLSCNEVELQEFQDGKRMELACLIAVSDQRTVWIVRYENNNWRWSATFERHYPELAKEIKSYGLNAVRLCAFGPGPGERYYTGWDEFRIYSCSPKFTKAMKSIKNNSSIGSVIAVAFGHGSSFLVSYGFESGHLGWTHDLQGYYPSLNRFLKNQKELGNKISIHAATLDPFSKTDYLVVFTDNDGRDRSNLKYKMHCSNSNTRQAVRDWWEVTKGRQPPRASRG